MKPIIDHKNLVLWISLFSCICGFAQSEFQIEGGKRSFKLPFEQVNNLMIIPVELNGVELSFLLDTGVDATVLFKLPENDSLVVENASKIWIKGMGMENPVEGFRSRGNRMKIGNAIHENFTFYTVYEKHTDLSQRMGFQIHGIIGNDFFKDFVIEMRYLRNYIKVYEPATYNFKKCRKCEEFDLKFHRNKPYITLSATINGEIVMLNLLIDSGSGDALWLFTNEDKNLTIPPNNFPDFLGYGFGGSIYGSKSRIKELDFGKFQLKELIASFPDTTYTEVKEEFIHRDGSVGAQVLNRFRVILDYRGEKIWLRPNRKFSDPFNYEMSGIALAHTGFILEKEKILKPVEREEQRYPNEHSMEENFIFKPEYEIVEIRPNSPAETSGLATGDIIKKINGKPAHHYSLEEIIAFFSSPEGKRIKLKIERDGVDNTIVFVLKQAL